MAASERRFEAVDLTLVCILRMVKDDPGCAQNSVAPNISYQVRVRELIARGYIRRDAKFSGLYITFEGDSLLNRLMGIVGEFGLGGELDELIGDTLIRAEHKREYAREWSRRKERCCISSSSTGTPTRTAGGTSRSASCRPSRSARSSTDWASTANTGSRR